MSYYAQFVLTRSKRKDNYVNYAKERGQKNTPKKKGLN